MNVKKTRPHSSSIISPSHSEFMKKSNQVVIGKQGQLLRLKDSEKFKKRIKDEEDSDFNFLTSTNISSKFQSSYNNCCIINPYDDYADTKIGNYLSNNGAKRCGPWCVDGQHLYGCLSVAVREERKKFKKSISQHLSKINGNHF
jgi:hypothetical protein